MKQRIEYRNKTFQRKSYSSGSAHSMDAKYLQVFFALLHEIHCSLAGWTQIKNQLSPQSAAYVRFEQAIVLRVRIFSWFATANGKNCTCREKNLYSLGRVYPVASVLSGFPRENRLSLTNSKNVYGCCI